MLDVEHGEISGLMSEDCGRLFFSVNFGRQNSYQVLDDIPVTSNDITFEQLDRHPFRSSSMT